MKLHHMVVSYRISAIEAIIHNSPKHKVPTKNDKSVFVSVSVYATSISNAISRVKAMFADAPVLVFPDPKHYPSN